jgi:hypothetical protein
MIPIYQVVDNIFMVLNQAVDIIYSAKTRLGEECKYDIDARIKLAVIHNNFRNRFPDLSLETLKSETTRPKQNKKSSLSS